MLLLCSCGSKGEVLPQLDRDALKQVSISQDYSDDFMIDGLDLEFAEKIVFGKVRDVADTDVLVNKETGEWNLVYCYSIDVIYGVDVKNSNPITGTVEVKVIHGNANAKLGVCETYSTTTMLSKGTCVAGMIDGNGYVLCDALFYGKSADDFAIPLWPNMLPEGMELSTGEMPVRDYIELVMNKHIGKRVIQEKRS